MMLHMRTTVTLDPDVQALLEKMMRERSISFKVALNDALRISLRPAPREPAQFPTFDMGARIDLTKALQVAGELEDQEILRKMHSGK